MPASSGAETGPASKKMRCTFNTAAGTDGGWKRPSQRLFDARHLELFDQAVGHFSVPDVDFSLRKGCDQFAEGHSAALLAVGFLKIGDCAERRQGGGKVVKRGGSKVTDGVARKQRPVDPALL